MSDMVPEVLNAALDSLFTPKEPGELEYQGDDGLLYCRNCHTPVQCRVKLWGRDKIVPCLCRCQQEAMAEKKRQDELAERHRKIRQLKATGIQEKHLLEWNFAVAEDNKDIQMAKRYVEQWKKVKAENLGLLLWGDVGTGKSFVAACIANLSGMFDSVNQQVGQIAGDVGTTPANFSPAVFSMIRNISESVILPIAGMVLTFIACYELIQMLIEHNNLANFETWTFFKWVFKTFLAVTLISNTFNITMAVFDVAQQVISRSGGLISGSTSVSDATLTAMQATLEGMDLGPLLGLYLQTFVVQVTMLALSAIIFVIVYGRMVEIYLMVSLAPIPFATFGNHEQSHTGQNYLRSLFALGFQGFLIMICVGIYAVLIQNLSFSDNIISSIWGVLGYTVLLAFTLFKTGSLAKSVFAAH